MDNPNNQRPMSSSLSPGFLSAVNADGSPRLRKGFSSAVNADGSLQKAFVPIETTQQSAPIGSCTVHSTPSQPTPANESSTVYSPQSSTIVQAEDTLYVVDETPIVSDTFDKNGTPQRLVQPFQKAIPAENVSHNQLINAVKNTLAICENTPPYATEQTTGKIARPSEDTDCIHDRFTTDKNGIFYNNLENSRREHLCNFRIVPLKIIQYIRRDVSLSSSVESSLLLEDRSYIFTIDTKKIDDLPKMVKEQHPTAIVYSDATKAESHISEYFRSLLKDLPRETIQTLVGWSTYKSKKIFAHDARLVTKDMPKMQTNKAILSDTRYEAFVATFTSATNLGTLTITAPMLATCLLGFLHVPFSEVSENYSPHYVLFINGPTGTLKTATSKIIFNIYNSDSPYLVASFKDTATSIEIRLKELPCSPILIDDFYATGLSKERTDMQKTLETIIRYVGDGIGKNRSNAGLQDVKGSRPTGTVIITGEDTAGQMSTMLRCLILNVDKTTFNREVLSDFQKNPLRWSTFISHFLLYLEDNYARILMIIQENYPVLRNCYAKDFADLRPVDQLVQLNLVYYILQDFFRTNFPRCLEIQTLLDSCIDANCTAVKESQEYATQNSHERLYAFTLAKLISHQKILIAESRQNYVNEMGTLDGFFEKGFLYLNADSVYTKVRRHFQQQGRDFPLTQLNAHRALNQANLLITEIEKKKNGAYKTHLEVKVSIGKERPRMLKLDWNAFKSYMEGDSQ